MEECHADQVKALAGETEEQRSRIAQMEKEINCLQTELAAQKEANIRSPSNTMKSLVERLKAQLTQKEKQLKVVLSHVVIFRPFNQNNVLGKREGVCSWLVSPGESLSFQYKDRP